MHCVSLADLAATLSQHAPSLLQLRPRVSNTAIMRYWTASRSRHELWHRVMGRYRDAKNNGNYSVLANWWHEHRVVLEEILVSEMLARVVASIGAATADLDDHESHQSLAAVTHGVYLTQIEASNRVAQIILESAGAKTQDLATLNRLRYGVERWTDLLLGRLNLSPSRSFEYCIDQDRAREFCEEARENSVPSQREMMTRLMNAAMHDMLIRRTSHAPALGNANREVGSAALSLFQPQLFDSHGVPKSLWLSRIENGFALPRPNLLSQR